MTDLAQGGALGLGQQEPAFQLGFEDAVLGGEIFIAQQELLIDRPGDVGENASPVHLLLRAGFRYKIGIVGVVRRGEQPVDRPPKIK